MSVLGSSVDCSTRGPSALENKGASSPLVTQFDRQRVIASRLESLIEHLESKVSPLMVPPGPPRPAPGDAPNGQVIPEITAVMTDHNNRFQRSLDQLESLVDRIQL